jgi:hypothetical protein
MAAPSAAEEKECKAYLRSFLRSLFTEARLQAERLFAGKKKFLYADMAKMFYDFFKDPSQRETFYGKVITNSNGSPTEVWKSFDDLQKSLKGRCSDWPRISCPTLISMDEVHVLFGPRSRDAESSHTVYSRLKSVLSEAVSKDLVVIFLSTATSVAKLAPSKEVAPSMRERDDSLILPVPFTELPFDVHIISEPLLIGQEELTSVGTLEFTAKFGRPLYVGMT